MVGDARFVNVKLRVRKLGRIEIDIVLNTFVSFASPKYGLKYESNDFCVHGLPANQSNISAISSILLSILKKKEGVGSSRCFFYSICRNF